MDIKNSPIYVFAEVTNIFKSNFEKNLTETGIHGGQIFILISLFEENGESQKVLADKLNLSAPTIFNMVKSLSQNGFVKCRRCSRDGRSMRVYLTPKSINIKELILAKWHQFDQLFFSSFTETERLIFFQLLDKIKGDFIKQSA